jgi:hypothetical protein
MTGRQNLGSQGFSPNNCCIHVVNLEPEEQPIPGGQILWIADLSVVMLHFPAMQLQDQFAGGYTTFIR